MLALGFARANSINHNIVGSAAIEARESFHGVSHDYRLPIAGGMEGANGNIVDMEIVVGIADGRLTIEGDFDILSAESGEVDAHILARGGAIDIVQDIVGTSIVPLAQDSPGGGIVVGNENDEFVVGTGSLRSTESAAIGGQSQVEAEGGIVSHHDIRGYKPPVTARTIEVTTDMAVENAIARAEGPAAGGRGQGSAAHHIAQQTSISGPAVRNSSSAEFLGNTFNIFACPVVYDIHVVCLRARPSHGCCMGSNISDTVSRQKWCRARCQGRECNGNSVGKLLLAIGDNAEFIRTVVSQSSEHIARSGYTCNVH